MQLADALKTEMDRHQAAEKSLQLQISEFQDELEARNHELDTKISELSATKEAARQFKKTERTLQDKIKSLEDEMQLFHKQMEEDQDAAKKQIDATKFEMDSLQQKLNEARLEVTRLRNQHANAQADIRNIQGDLQADAKTHMQLQLDIDEANRRLENALKEKLQVHEKFLAVQSQLNSLQAASAELKVERDELKTLLSKSTKNGDLAKGLDSEMMDLRKVKGRLEIELQHATEERDILERKVDELEAELDEAVEAARENEEKQWTLGQDVKKLADSREREQQKSQQKIARLEAKIEELLKQDSHDIDAEAEVSSLRGHLEEARKRESDIAQKEANMRKERKELSHRVSKLEQELQDARNLAALAQSSGVSTPRSSRQSVEDELRRQLSTAQEQIRDHRSSIKTMDRNLGDQKAANDELMLEMKMLEQEMTAIRKKNDALVKKNLETASTIGELRKTICNLERDFHEAQINKNLKDSEISSQPQMAEERRDLYDRLKKLQSQLRFSDTELQGSQKRECELESQLHALEKDKKQLDTRLSGALSDLDKVNRQYQRALKKTEQLQQAWDEERKAIKQRVRFSETNGRKYVAKSTKDFDDAEKSTNEAEKRHHAEIKGLAKQVRYLQAKVSREASFRSDLAFSKNFFLMQIQLYSSWYVHPLFPLSFHFTIDGTANIYCL
jgi:chromosome segregation ATPase